MAENKVTNSELLAVLHERSKASEEKHKEIKDAMKEMKDELVAVKKEVVVIQKWQVDKDARFKISYFWLGLAATALVIVVGFIVEYYSNQQNDRKPDRTEVHQ